MADELTKSEVPGVLEIIPVAPGITVDDFPVIGVARTQEAFFFVRVNEGEVLLTRCGEVTWTAQWGPREG